MLVCVDCDHDGRLQDIATEVGVTLRAAQSIVTDLVAAGYVDLTLLGRRNRHDVHRQRALQHPLERHRSVGDLLDAVGPVGPPAR